MTRGLVCAIVSVLVLEGTAQSASTIAGRISLPDGTPAPGVAVFAAVSGRDGRLRDVAETVSEWDGQYRLSGVAPGQYVIGTRATRQAPPTYYPSVSDAAERRVVTLFDSVPAEGIDIWLHPLPQRYAVSGRVYWPDGQSIDNLVIEYGGPANPRQGLWYVFDPGGLFHIEAAPPGTMVMLARADSDAGPLIGMASTDISVAPVEEVRIVLERPGSIDGRIVFQRPLPPGSAAAQVVAVHSLLRVSPLYPVESGAIVPDGRFRIPIARGIYTFALAGVPAGWRVTRVRRAGRDVGSVTVGPAEAVTQVELTVAPAGM